MTLGYLAFWLLSEGEAKGGLLDVNPGLIFWTVITFFLLLLILSKFGLKPILSAISARENSIKDSLDKAELAKKEAEILLAENKKNLAMADEEAQKVRKQAMADASLIMEKMVKESEEKAIKRINEAEKEIQRKYDEAFRNLRGQVAEIAISAAEKIIKENLDKEKQTKLVNKLIDDLPKN